MTLSDTITTLGNNIVSLIGTRANKDLSNLSTIGESKLGGGSGYHPPILCHMFSDHMFNDIQWLRADTFSWQDSKIYTAAYDELYAEYTNTASTTEIIDGVTCKVTPKGYHIALSGLLETINNNFKSNKNAWFFVLDTSNKKFKLPRSVHGDLVENAGDMVQGYRVYADGYCEQWGRTNGPSDNAWTDEQITFQKWFRDNTYIITTAVQYRESQTNSYNYCNVHALTPSGFKLNTHSYKDGIHFWRACGYVETTKITNKQYLYFYVGDYTQEAIRQTAGITSEALNSKVDESSLVEGNIVIKDYVNGTSGYRIWSNGYCEQWGQTSVPSDGSTTTTLTKTYKDTNFSAIATFKYIIQSTDNGIGCNPASTNTIYLQNSNNGAEIAQWRTYGYLAAGQY